MQAWLECDARVYTCALHNGMIGMTSCSNYFHDRQLTASQPTAAAPWEGVCMPFGCLAAGVSLLDCAASPGLPASADMTAANEMLRIVRHVLTKWPVPLHSASSAAALQKQRGKPGPTPARRITALT